MKITVELSDPLFQSAKQLAQESQTTLRALIEEGLRRVLAEQLSKPKQAFKLKNASVCAKAVLMPDPSQWQSQETEHLARTLLPAVKR